MISHYLIDAIILLAAAVVAVTIFQAIKLGAVPGFLISGVIVGPSGLGLINNTSEIGHLAEIGVVLLLFIIGIELKPSRLWLMKRLVFGLGTLQVLLTGFLLGGVCLVFFEIPLEAAILVGPALALSSTAFVLQLLGEQKLLTSEYGRTSISILLLQDIAVVPLLALVPLLAMPELNIGEDIAFALIESLLILGLIILLGRYLLHPVLHRVALSGNSEIFTASAVLMVLGTALITEHVGLSMAMGAFLAGLLISDSPYRHQVVAEIQPFRGLLLGLFFMSMGMSLNLSLLFGSPLVSIGVTSLLIVIKIVMLFPLPLLFGIRITNSFAVALVLAQSGEFALVLFSLAYQADILTEKLFQHLLLVVLLSMLATPALAHLAQRFSKLQYIKTERDNDIPDDASIVIAGFGRVGHRIGEILSMARVPFIALDYDASIVERERENGHPVYYGDVCKPELLKSAGVSNSRIIIVTLNNPETTAQVVSTLRKTYSEIDIYVRCHELNRCCELRKLGASGAVSENVEASLELARLALMKLGLDNKSREDILGGFRKAYHAKIDDVE